MNNGSFKKPWWARGPHAQTILGSWTNNACSFGNPSRVLVDLGDGDTLVAFEDNPDSSPVACALLMHGLGGTSESGYMLSTGAVLTGLGFSVFRLNHRGSGEGCGQTRLMYNSGISADLPPVFEAMNARHPGLPIVALGFSMSGNILLKYLAEAGPGVVSNLVGAVAVNPSVDLKRSITLINQGINRLYELRFIRLLKRQYANHLRARGENGSLPASIRTLMQFDELITAPMWGYRSADHYYESCSTKNILHKVGLDTVIVSSVDDPMVPFDSFEDARLSPTTRLEAIPGGGHIGYLSANKTPCGNRRWMDWRLGEIAGQFLKMNP